MNATYAACLLFAATALAATGCAADTGDEEDDGEETALTAAEVSAASEVTVVQFNPYYGGQYPMNGYTQDRSKLPKSYATAEQFSKLLRQHHPNASVIGMQEMDSAQVAEEMRKRLGADGPRAWRVKWYGGEKQTGSAIYWRDDVIAFERDLGKHVVNHFSKEHGGVATTFGGALLKKKGTKREFGFFTGKLTPRTYDGHRDQEKDDEARSLTAWIGRAMASEPRAARIVAIDMNDFYEGLAWKVFDKTFTDGKDARPTWKSPNTGNWHRYDYLWYDYDGGKKRSGGIASGPIELGGTGSDHRAVVTRFRIRQSD